MATIHANTPRDALSRLENMITMAATSLPTRAIRSQIVGAVNLVIQVSRMRDGIRRVTHVTEVIGPMTHSSRSRSWIECSSSVPAPARALSARQSEA